MPNTISSETILSALSKVQEPGGDSPFAEITDEDIDNLFND